MEAGTSCPQAGVPQSPYHHRSSHQQRAAMARFPKLPPVVFVTVQLPIFLIVPVSEGILAFRAPWRKQRNKVPVGNKSKINDPFLHGEYRHPAAAHHQVGLSVMDVLNPSTSQCSLIWELAPNPRFVTRGGFKQYKEKEGSKVQNKSHTLKHISRFISFASLLSPSFWIQVSSCRAAQHSQELCSVSVQCFYSITLGPGHLPPQPV